MMFQLKLPFSGIGGSTKLSGSPWRFQDSGFGKGCGKGGCKGYDGWSSWGGDGYSNGILDKFVVECKTKQPMFHVVHDLLCHKVFYPTKQQMFHETWWHLVALSCGKANHKPSYFNLTVHSRLFCDSGDASLLAWPYLIFSIPNCCAYLKFIFEQKTRSKSILLVGGFKHFFMFHNIWDNPNPIDELIYFSRWLLHHQPDLGLSKTTQLPP